MTLPLGPACGNVTRGAARGYSGSRTRHTPNVEHAELVIESQDGWTLAIGGWTITRLYFDPYAVGVAINGGTGDAFHAYIEASFTYRDADGSEQLFAPGEGAPTLAPLLSLLNRTVETVRVSRDGTLLIAFSDGTRISVPPDPDYEAWNGGLDEIGFISTPGGRDLVVRKPDRDLLVRKPS